MTSALPSALPTPPVYDRVHRACTALGCRLFTVSVTNADGTACARAYTSHPVEYPVSGIKPLTRDAWYDHVFTGLNSFIANTPPEFEKVFFDHGLITSLGLGSALNIPIIKNGSVLGTVNILAEALHFTPDLMDAYHAATLAERDPLVAAMQAT